MSSFLLPGCGGSEDLELIATRDSFPGLAVGKAVAIGPHALERELGIRGELGMQYLVVNSFKYVGQTKGRPDPDTFAEGERGRIYVYKVPKGNYPCITMSINDGVIE